MFRIAAILLRRDSVLAWWCTAARTGHASRKSQRHTVHLIPLLLAYKSADGTSFSMDIR